MGIPRPSRPSRGPRAVGGKSCFLRLFRRGFADLTRSAPCGKRIRNGLAFLHAVWCGADENGYDLYRVPMGERDLGHVTAICRRSGIGQQAGPFWGSGHACMPAGGMKGQEFSLPRMRARLHKDRFNAVVAATKPQLLWQRLLKAIDVSVPLASFPVFPANWPYPARLWNELSAVYPELGQLWNAIRTYVREAEIAVNNDTPHAVAAYQLWSKRLDKLQKWIVGTLRKLPTYPKPRRSGRPNGNGPLAETDRIRSETVSPTVAWVPPMALIERPVYMSVGGPIPANEACPVSIEVRNASWHADAMRNANPTEATVGKAIIDSLL